MTRAQPNYAVVGVTQLEHGPERECLADDAFAALRELQLKHRQWQEAGCPPPNQPPQSAAATNDRHGDLSHQPLETSPGQPGMEHTGAKVDRHGVRSPQEGSACSARALRSTPRRPADAR
jgi:hypothetical protein